MALLWRPIFISHINKNNTFIDIIPQITYLATT